MSLRTLRPVPDLITPAWGNVHPLGGATIDPEALVGAMRAAGLLGAVAEGSPGAGASVEVLVLVDEAQRVWQRGPGGPTPGPSEVAAAELLAAATGWAVDLGEASVGPEGSVLDEQGFWVLPDRPVPAPPATPVTDPPDVLVCRADPERLGVLARASSSELDVTVVDGWSVVRFCRPDARLHAHQFAADEVPALALSRVGGVRYASVLTGRGWLPGFSLSRQPVLLPSWGPDDLHGVDPDLAATLTEVAAWCANQHLEVASEASLLVAEPGFTHVAVAELAAALAEPVPERWSTRVLEVLGLPVLAADVHEGRADLPGARRVQPSGRWAAVRHTIGNTVGHRFRAGRRGRPQDYHD